MECTGCGIIFIMNASGQTQGDKALEQILEYYNYLEVGILLSERSFVENNVLSKVGHFSFFLLSFFISIVDFISIL